MRKKIAMFRSVAALWILILTVGAASADAYPVNCFQKKETLFQKTGDWFATLGKEGQQKERILVKRKRDRIRACAEKNLETGPRGKMR